MKRLARSRGAPEIAAVLLSGVGCLAASAQAAPAGQATPPVLQSETASVTPFQGLTAHELAYSAMDAIAPPGIRIIDGDTAKPVGTVYSSEYANFAWAADNRTLYVSETYWTMGNRGKREDVLSIYGGPTLQNEGEIALPGRLISDPKTNSFALSPDEHYAYDYSFQPAPSVTVVDLKQRKVLTSVEVPGCGLVFPFGERGFASLCGDGSLAVADADAKGQYSVHRSKRFFDIMNDPVFDESVADRKSGLALFITYDGWVHPVHLGDQPAFDEPWSIEKAAGLSAATSQVGQITWRPGGQAMAAYHAATGRLFVTMHEGHPWSSEQGGSQVWVLDVRQHRLIKRFDVPEAATLVAVTQDAQPLLFALSDGWLWVMSPDSGAVLRAVQVVPPGVLRVRGH